MNSYLKDLEIFDNAFTKVIRPLSIVISLGVFFFIMFADGNWGDFTVKEIYIKTLGSMIEVQFIFYFTSKGVEKSVKNYASVKGYYENKKKSGLEFDDDDSPFA